MEARPLVRSSVSRGAEVLLMALLAVACASTRHPIAESLVGTDVPAPRVGMFYLVWHAPAATALRTVAAKGGVPLTVEDVIRSNGALKLADMLQKWGLEADADWFYYHVRPKLGFYCIYRARPGQAGLLPDCPKIRSTLSKHASQLTKAGVDYVVIDATNLTKMDREGDLLQLRPTEVLFEEWAKLRAKGKQTPQIAVWNAVPTGSIQWQGYQTLYQDPAYDGLVMHDKRTGKKVFFIVDPTNPADTRFPDASIVAAIESNGGRNDVLVQRMWTIDRTDPSVDRWAFMSWCQDNGKVTTNIVGAPPCAQPHTEKSALGRAIAIAPSFQTSYGSLPFASAGRLGGLTFLRQWETAFTVRPDYVFISGWNEFVAQPQPNPFPADQWARSAGLETDPDSRVFVDTYGAEFGRDIEPTDEYGTKYYDLTASCIRVFKANAGSGAGTCSIAGVSCCDPSGQSWVNVFVLKHAGANDVLLTTAKSERDALLTPGTGWREVCARYGTPTLFCTDANEPESPAAPFVALAVAGPGRQPLHRCLIGNRHFYSLDPACEGHTTEGILAYLPQAKTSESARAARRCLRSTGEHFVALAPACPAGTTDEGLLGYVH